jgi:MFS family permease
MAIPTVPPSEATVKRSLLGNADYVWYSLARTSSVAGSQLTYVAFPLYALAITRSAAAAGLVGLATYGSSMLVAPWAGAIADRRNRRAVMLACDLARTAALGVLAAAIAAGWSSLSLTLAVCLVSGGCTALFTAASHAALPSIVGTPLLSRALARNQTRDFLLSLAGPIAGAYLFSRSPALPFTLDAVSYALSLALLIPMRPEAVEYSAPARAQPTGSAIRSGLALLRHRPVLRDAGLCLAMLNLLLTGSTFGLIVLTQSGGPHPVAAGTIITAQAAGGLMGSLMADRVAHRLGPRAVVLLQVWVWVAALSAFALAPPLAVMLGLSAAVWSVTPALRTVLMSYLAANVPSDYRGRLTSSVFLLGQALAPAGPLTFGALATASSPSLAMLAFAGCALVTAAAVSTLSPLGRSPWPSNTAGDLG